MNVNLSPHLRRSIVIALALASPAIASAQKFVFGTQKAQPGTIAVAPDMTYSAARGFGFEPGAQLTASESAVRGEKPFFFTLDLPEGNYQVTVGYAGPGPLTVKSEMRRLMLENVRSTRSFNVNVRTPKIAAAPGIAAGVVNLKAPRETVQEATAWDQRLTLEFNGERPAIASLEIVPVKVPTIFLLGDSTVCDQPGEPYNSWGQMLPRFFKPGIAVANHGQSGETYRDSIARRRLDKILSAMAPGDTVIMQFGHNDQKQMKDNKGGPFTTYKDEIKVHVDAVRARGGVPVIVSPMERRRFDDKGKAVQTLTDYAEAARQSAAELKTAFIDLHKMSMPFYEALGPQKSEKAFAEPLPGKIDNTHHNSYGSYQLARMVASEIRRTGLPAAAFIAEDLGQVDPSRPEPVESFAVQPSPTVSTQRPLGDEANK